MTELYAKKTASYRLSVTMEERDLYSALFHMSIKEATNDHKTLVYDALTEFVRSKHKRYIDFYIVPDTLWCNLITKNMEFAINVITSIK